MKAINSQLMPPTQLPAKPAIIQPQEQHNFLQERREEIRNILNDDVLEYGLKSPQNYSTLIDFLQGKRIPSNDIIAACMKLIDAYEQAHGNPTIIDKIINFINIPYNMAAISAQLKKDTQKILTKDQILAIVQSSEFLTQIKIPKIKLLLEKSLNDHDPHLLMQLISETLKQKTSTAYQLTPENLSNLLNKITGTKDFTPKLVMVLLQDEKIREQFNNLYTNGLAGIEGLLTAIKSKTNISEQNFSYPNEQLSPKDVGALLLNFNIDTLKKIIQYPQVFKDAIKLKPELKQILNNNLIKMMDPNIDEDIIDFLMQATGLCLQYKLLDIPTIQQLINLIANIEPISTRAMSFAMDSIFTNVKLKYQTYLKLINKSMGMQDIYINGKIEKREAIINRRFWQKAFIHNVAFENINNIPDPIKTQYLTMINRPNPMLLHKENICKAMGLLSNLEIPTNTVLTSYKNLINNKYTKANPHMNLRERAASQILMRLAKTGGSNDFIKEEERDLHTYILNDLLSTHGMHGIDAKHLDTEMDILNISKAIFGNNMSMVLYRVLPDKIWTTIKAGQGLDFGYAYIKEIGHGRTFQNDPYAYVKQHTGFAATFLAPMLESVILYRDIQNQDNSVGYVIVPIKHLVEARCLLGLETFEEWDRKLAMRNEDPWIRSMRWTKPPTTLRDAWERIFKLYTVREVMSYVPINIEQYKLLFKMPDEKSNKKPPQIGTYRISFRRYLS